MPDAIYTEARLRLDRSRAGTEVIAPADRHQAKIARNVDDAIDAVEGKLATFTGFTFFTLNLDHLVKLEADKAFRRAYETADFISPDGWPIAAWMRRHSKTVRRTTGADLLMPLCKLAARERLPVYLFGSTTDVLDKASLTIRQECPDVIICGATSPAFGFDPSSAEAGEAIRSIAASGARMCFVALGAPKQEIFAAQALASCPMTGFFGIGASLDYVAGLERRAPYAIQVVGMEWAWRLMMSPRRLFARYVRCAGLFLTLMLSKRKRTLFYKLVDLSPPDNECNPSTGPASSI